MLMFTADIPPQPNPLLTVIIEKQVEVEPPKTYTIEEQVKLNVNNCNEDIEWIRADNAQCLPKRVVTARTTQNNVRTAGNASDGYSTSGWFPYGQCTYYVASQRNVGQWNNASQWLRQAQADGWATGSIPIVGAIAWEPNHVSLVIGVDGNSVTVREMNYEGFGVISTRTAPATQFKYIY